MTELSAEKSTKLLIEPTNILLTDISAELWNKSSNEPLTNSLTELLT